MSKRIERRKWGKKASIDILRFSGAKQYCPRAVVCLKISTGKDKTGVSIYRGVLEQCFSCGFIFDDKLESSTYIQPFIFLFPLFFLLFLFFFLLLSVINIITRTYRYSAYVDLYIYKEKKKCKIQMTHSLVVIKLTQ